MSEDKKTKKNKIFGLLLRALVSTITGLGMYYWFTIFKWNIHVCLFFGLFSSAIMMNILSNK